jgi:O-antigen ligase
LVYESWKTEYIAESRTRIWVKGILAAKERLWLGYGWANFDLAFDSIIWPIEYEGDVYVDKAHSHFLEIGVGGGLIGLLLYFFIIWQMIVNLFRKKGDLSEMFLGGLFLFIWQTQLNVISIASEVVFWVMLAYSASNS